MDKFSELMESAIKAKLTVCDHCECNVYKDGIKKKIKKRTINFCCENCAKAYKELK